MNEYNNINKAATPTLTIADKKKAIDVNDLPIVKAYIRKATKKADTDVSNYDKEVTTKLTAINNKCLTKLKEFKNSMYLLKQTEIPAVKYIEFRYMATYTKDGDEYPASDNMPGKRITEYNFNINNNVVGDFRLMRPFPIGSSNSISDIQVECVSCSGVDKDGNVSTAEPYFDFKWKPTTANAPLYIGRMTETRDCTLVFYGHKDSDNMYVSDTDNKRGINITVKYKITVTDVYGNVFTKYFEIPMYTITKADGSW